VLPDLGRAPVEKNFHLSDAPLPVEKVRDIVGLYMSPPDSAVVYCVDEKSQIQALERAQPVLPRRALLRLAHGRGTSPRFAHYTGSA
jgi:hypothetical protein